MLSLRCGPQCITASLAHQGLEPVDVAGHNKLVVTFRLDEATRDRIREIVRDSPHLTSSASIPAAIEQLLKREEERPSGWTVRR
jgi:hypothetical protein